ncbi:MAG: hypothetical protein ACEPOV_12935 [Hyphomicrobiales bacterium]
MKKKIFYSVILCFTITISYLYHSDVFASNKKGSGTTYVEVPGRMLSPGVIMCPRTQPDGKCLVSRFLIKGSEYDKAVPRK